jgi:hypothetical protein
VNEHAVANGAAGDKTVDEVAYGFLRVANEAMCRPIRNLTTMRGYDITTHALACFGGAGPQHCCAIAKVRLKEGGKEVFRYYGPAVWWTYVSAPDLLNHHSYPFCFFGVAPAQVETPPSDSGSNLTVGLGFFCLCVWSRR